MIKFKTTEAQRRASKKQRAKAAGNFPGTSLNQYEADLLERMAEKHGGKKAALIAGLQLLEISKNE